MKILKTVFVASVISACLSTSVFADINFSGKVGTDIAITAPWTKNPGNFVIGDIFVDGKLNYYTGNSSLVVDGSLKYDLVKATSPEYTVDFISGMNAFTGKIREAYFDYNGSFWALRIGRQISMWGAADNFIVSNVLCPVDESNISSLDVSDKMLGIDALKLSFNNDFFIADLYWIPFFTPSSLPIDKGNPLKKMMIPSSVEIPVIGKTAIKDFTSSDITLPELSLLSGEYAARISTYFSFADFSLYGFYGWDDSPFIAYEYDGSDIQLKGSYKRLLMIGADSSIPAGPVTIRLETSFYPQRYFGTSAEKQLAEQIVQLMTDGTIDHSKVRTCEQHDQLCALVGIDWMSGDWTITAQYFADYVFGDVSNLDRKAFDHKASLSIGYSIVQANIDLNVAAIVDFVDFDSAVVASVEYGLTDQIKICATGYLLNAGPERNGTYGKLKDFSCLKLNASYSF